MHHLTGSFKKLGIPLTTVRNGINSMYKSRVILGSTLFPNPNLVNLRAAAYNVEIQDGRKKADAFQEMKLVEGVVSAHDFVGSRGWIVVVYKNEAEREKKLRLFNAISGQDGVFINLPYPPCPHFCTKHDADLILQLSKNEFDNYAKLGTYLGIPVRTLKRSISRIVHENMLLSLPRVVMQRW